MGIRKRVLTLLHQRSGTLGEVRDVLKELYRNIGDEGERPGRRCTWRLKQHRSCAKHKVYALGEALWSTFTTAPSLYNAAQQRRSDAAALIPWSVSPALGKHRF